MNRHFEKVVQAGYLNFEMPVYFFINAELRIDISARNSYL